MRTGRRFPGRSVLGKSVRRRLRQRRRTLVRSQGWWPVHAGVLRSGPAHIDGRPMRRRDPAVFHGQQLLVRWRMHGSRPERMVHRERAQRLRDLLVPERHLVDVHGHERRILSGRVLEPTRLFLAFPRRDLQQ